MIQMVKLDLRLGVALMIDGITMKSTLMKMGRMRNVKHGMMSEMQVLQASKSNGKRISKCECP
jgi:hypothetical protein